LQLDPNFLHTSEENRQVSIAATGREALSGSLDRIQRAASVILATVNAGG
jgi:hypothetical protein